MSRHSHPDYSPTYGRTGWEYGGAYGEEYGSEHRTRRGRWQREALTAAEIMTGQVRTAHKDAPLQTVAQIMKEENCGIVPVVDEKRKLLGVVTDRDMVIRTLPEDKNFSEVRIGDIMTDDVEAVTPEEELKDVIELMGRKQIRRVPVVDWNDRLLGIISMADIANRAEYDLDLQEALERISARRSFWSRLWK
jgi:CBS domain-containing protein